MVFGFCAACPAAGRLCGRCPGGDSGRFTADVIESPNETEQQLSFYEFRESPETDIRLAMSYLDYTLYWKRAEPEAEAAAENALLGT